MDWTDTLSLYFKSNNDIIKDKEFEEANSVYEAQCVYLKRRGLAKTEHKPPIAEEDIKKLYESDVFITDSTATLQNKIFFENMLFFCRRGTQNLRELKRDDFAIKMNPQGQRCVVKKSAELTKNHRVHDAQAEEGGMMVANDSPYCPVYSFEIYLTHLNPLNEFLFRRRKHAWQEDESTIKRSKAFRWVYQPLDSSNHNYNPRQKRLWSKTHHVREWSQEWEQFKELH